jgi:hypothetical protein
MRVYLRQAGSGDAMNLYSIKEQLRFKLENMVSKQAGGFLLGTSLEAYKGFIQNDVVYVAEQEHPRQVVGFAIAMQHETLAQSVLMERAEQVQWESAFHLRFDAKRFAFFEQLGMLADPAYRVYAKYLAFSATRKALQTHEAIFTTVLKYPVHNTAAIPFIKVIGFDFVGTVDEIYPEIGPIKSDVYHLSRATFERKITEPRFKTLISRGIESGLLDECL